MRLISLAGEQYDPRLGGIDGRAECIPVGVTGVSDMGEIIHSGPFQTAVTERKSAGFNDIHRYVQARTSP